MQFIEPYTLIRARLRWEDNIKMGPKETGYEVVYWIYLAQDKV
jgi:hypothetical protein